MTTENEGPVDLFGQPWLEPRDPRGRKSHRWNMQVAESIVISLATGATQEEAAVRVGLSVPTMKKYYFRELQGAGERIRQAVVSAQLKAALKGSTSAAKFIRDELERTEQTEIAYQPRPAAAPKLGKKEERQAAAEEVGGIFAPAEPPLALRH